VTPPERSIFKEGIEKPEILAILAEITDFAAFYGPNNLLIERQERCSDKIQARRMHILCVVISN
jgi:hypothetical protein